MKTVSKSKLKEKMLEYFREVERTGEDLVVLDHGVPVLKVVPFRQRRAPAEVFADLRGKARYFEDLTAPTEAEWSAV